MNLFCNIFFVFLKKFCFFFYFFFISTLLMGTFSQQTKINSQSIFYKQKQSAFLNYLPTLKKNNLKTKEFIKNNSVNEHYLESQVDILGNFRYSFPDKKENIFHRKGDFWQNIKWTFWTDPQHQKAFFISLLNSSTTLKEQLWQKYFEGVIGFQYIPFAQKSSLEFLRSLRFFSQCVFRYYKDKNIVPNKMVTPNTAADSVEWLNKHILPECYDIQIGLDYYKDNIFEDAAIHYSCWGSFAWYRTHFSNLRTVVNEDIRIDPIGRVGSGIYQLTKTGIYRKNYNAFALKSDFLLGKKIKFGISFLLPHLFLKSIFVPKYPDRFWENCLEMGYGLRWYLLGNIFDQLKSEFWKQNLKSFYIFGSSSRKIYLRHRDKNNENNSLFFGIAFSTSLNKLRFFSK